jgi:hypothetical protein
VGFRGGNPSDVDLAVDLHSDDTWSDLAVGGASGES